ncbi:TrbI/VirB10 family protein [Algiphilus sp. W345]|uniref:TrbI/VirB10 family protein n=1 Tax=Banduia mediterranea TaxID=3075609 RepID=A0ABU2WL38_9GAMM|nr:TrbI/VirB10 family protein [Algiphilus sp. W345]MDT0498581.1 TrbI/VirB10 family protein [Algiphilus sp. W345]
MPLPKLPTSETIRKRQTAITIGAFAAVIAIVVFGLWLSDPRRKAGGAHRVDPSTDYSADFGKPSGSIDPMDIWISRSEAELKALRRDNDQLRKDLGALRDQLDRKDESKVPRSIDRKRVDDQRDDAGTDRRNGTDAQRPPLPPLPGASTATRASSAPPRPPPIPTSGTAPVAPSSPGSIMSISVSSRSGGQAASGGEPTLDNFLPVSFVSATLLSGLDAPTGGLAQTNPHPVLLRLADNAWLPNRDRQQVRECFVTGAGYGDLSSERAYIRLELLSCVLQSREVMELPVKGYVSGEDGKVGLRGRLVSKQGAMIARALFAGIAGGVGSAIAQSYTQTATSALGTVSTIPPSDIAEHGIAQGTANALERIADYYIDRANELYPIIEIEGGRHTDVVFNEGVRLPEAFERVMRRGTQDASAAESTPGSVIAPNHR